MKNRATLFLQQITGIKAAIDKLDEGTTTLSRGITVLRQHTPAEFADQHRLMEAMDSAVDRMLLAHGMLREAVGKLLPPSDPPGPAGPPLDTLRHAAATLTVVHSAMGVLANDREGGENLAPWQRELFAKSYDHIAGVVGLLQGAHRELRDKEGPGGPGGR